MNKCLVLQVQGESTRTDLPKLNVIRYNIIEPTSETRAIARIKFAVASSLKIYGGQFVTPYSPSSLIGDTVNTPANSLDFYETQLNVDGMSIEINNSNELLEIHTGAAHKVQISDLQFCDKLQVIQGEGIQGNLTLLANLEELKTIDLQYSLTVADANIFADANTFTSLTTLTLTGSPYISNKTAAVKAAIEAAHPGITVTW